MANTSLFHIEYPAGIRARQVDDFPKGTPRSRKGAVYVRPGATDKLTSQELDRVRSLLGKAANRLRVVRKVVPTPPPTSTPERKAKRSAETKASERGRSSRRSEPKTSEVPSE